MAYYGNVFLSGVDFQCGHAQLSFLSFDRTNLSILDTVGWNPVNYLHNFLPWEGRWQAYCAPLGKADWAVACTVGPGGQNEGNQAMTSTPNNDSWYALQVRARWERCTSAALSGKGYRILLPTYQARSLRRSSMHTAPLFPGYVFCQFDVNNRLPILVTAGVIAIVGRGRVPVPVENQEITALEAMVASGVSAEPCQYLEVGQRVRIEDHPLRGVEGILLAFKGQRRLVVSITLLRRSVTLEIDRANVTTLDSRHEPGPGFFPLEPALHS